MKLQELGDLDINITWDVVTVRHDSRPHRDEFGILPDVVTAVYVPIESVSSQSKSFTNVDFAKEFHQKLKKKALSLYNDGQGPKIRNIKVEAWVSVKQELLEVDFPVL